MLTKLEARKLAEETLGINSEEEVMISHNVSHRIEILILDENTLEFEFGWVFFYQSKKFIESGDWSYALGGNAPIIVDKYKKQTYSHTHLGDGKSDKSTLGL